MLILTGLELKHQMLTCRTRKIHSVDAKIRKYVTVQINGKSDA